MFAEPLKEMGLLAKKTHSILFPNQLIRLVYQHSVFLGRLEERLNNWHHVQKIGDLFSGRLTVVILLCKDAVLITRLHGVTELIYTFAWMHIGGLFKFID